MTSLSEWEFFHLLEGYLSDSLELRVAQVGEKLPSNCPRQAVKFVGQNYGRIFDAKQQAQLSFTNAAFHTINNVLNSMHHRGELQWQNAEDCYSLSKRVLKDLEKLYNIQTSAMVNDLEAKWPLVTKSFAHKNHLMVVTKTALPAFPFQDSSSTSGVLFSITVPEALVGAQDEIVEHLREVEEIKLLSTDTSQKGTIVGKVASENDIASILPEFTYRRQKHSVKLSHSFPLVLHPLHESKTVENVKMALKGMDVIPLKIHEPDRSTQIIMIEVSSQDDVNYIKEQGVSMKPQKLTVVEQPKPIPYVVYLAAPIKSLDSFKILWENHFQFLPGEIHTTSDLCSVAFNIEEKYVTVIELRAGSFRINGTKPVVVPYTPFRLKLGFSSPMEKAHLHAALGAITSNLSALSLHIPNFNDESSSTFFSAFLHSKEEGLYATFLSKEFTVSTYIPPPSTSSTSTPISPALPTPVINVPRSPSKTSFSTLPGHSQISLSFYLSVMEGITAPDVFSAFKAVGEEKGKGKGAWNILFVFERDGTFYVDVWGDSSLVEEVKSVLIGGHQVPVHKVEGEVPYYLLQISNIPSAFDKGKILNFFKNEKRRVGQISVKNGVAYVPVAKSDMHEYAKKKFISIENVKLPVSESEGNSKPKPAATQQVSKTVVVKPIEATFLKKNKDALEGIEADLSVTIHITTNRSRHRNPRHREKSQGKDNEKKGEDKDESEGKDNKPKEQKKKVDKEVKQSCTISVKGGSAENVERALEEVKAVLSANTLKTIGLPFKDGGLMKFTLPKLSEALHEFDSFSLVYELHSEPNKITLALFGEQVVVEEVTASISALYSEYAVDDSLKIPPTLNLDITALEAEYEVLLHFNKQSGKLQILGTKDAIAQLKDHINSQITNTPTVAQVKFAKEPFLFLQRFVFSDPKWQEDLTKIGVEVEQRGNGIMTIKGKDQKVVQVGKQHLEDLRQSIQEKKVVKTTAKYLVNPLEAYVKEQLEDVLVICKVVAAQTKSATTQNNENDDDDSDNGDDTSSVSSLSSSNSNIRQKTNSKEANVEIGAWYLKPLEGKVAQVLDSVVEKGVESVKFKYAAEDVPTIKGLNLRAIQEKHAVNIYNGMREKSFTVNGFDQASVQQVCNTIKTLLDKSGNKVTTITIAHHLYNFLKWRREELLQAIKQKHNLKRLELSCAPVSQPATASPKSRTTKDILVLEGPPAGVTAAQVELRAIRVKHIKVDGAEDKLKALEQDLRKNYDLSAFTIKRANHSVLVVTAEENMDKWDEVNAKLAALNPKASKNEVKDKDPKAKEVKSDEQDLSKGYPVPYSPEKGDFKLLYNSTRKKLVDLAEFKKNHGLLRKPFMSTRSSRITFTVTSQEQAAAAITAIIAVIAALKKTNVTEVIKEEEEQEQEEEEEVSSSDDEFGMDIDGCPFI